MNMASYVVRITRDTHFSLTVKTAVAKTLFNFKLSLIKLLNSVTEVEIMNIYALMLDWLPVFN